MLAVSSEVSRVRLVPAAASHKRYGVFNPYATRRTTKISKCTRPTITQIVEIYRE